MRDYGGCNNPKYKHGLTNHPLYRTWSNAKSRCSDVNAQSYKDYGGRGITVCDEWKDDFQAFYDWAMVNGYKKGLTLERIDNNKGYAPENCKWATMKEQSNNRRNSRYLEFMGKKRTISQWADAIGISGDALYHRLKLGWSIERALTSPKLKQINNKKEK